MPKQCVLCGATNDLTKEHIIPRCLYTKLERVSDIQLLTLPSCKKCNQSYSKDEAHFRNVMTLAGQPSGLVTELFKKKVLPSFDRYHQWNELAKLMEITRLENGPSGRQMRIYPAKSEAVLRVVKKILRGLGFFHFRSPIAEEVVWADVLKYNVPPKLLEGVKWLDFDPEVFRYFFEVCEVEEDRYVSVWLIRILGTCEFIASIDMDSSMVFDRTKCAKLRESVDKNRPAE